MVTVPLLLLLVATVYGQDPPPQVPGLAAWQAAVLAHTQAEGRLEQHVSLEEAARKSQEAAQKGSQGKEDTEKLTPKLNIADKEAFRNTLKAAVSKLLKNVGDKSKEPTKPVSKSSSSDSYLDDLLANVNKDYLPNGGESYDESLDNLISRSKNNYLSNRRIHTNRNKLATPESYLYKVRNNKRYRELSSRRQFELSRLLAGLEDDYSDYGFGREDFNFYDDFDDGFTRRKSGRLRSAMSASRRLGNDLEDLLRVLQGRRRRY